MIRIERIPTLPPAPTNPHYVVNCEYMIGDADGEETHVASLSTNNPYIERFVTLLENFEGHEITADTIKDLTKLGLLTADDADFLQRCFYPWDYKKRKTTREKAKAETKEQAAWLDEFQYCIENHHNLSGHCLTLETVYLRYIDANADEYYAIIEPNQPNQA